MDSIRYTGQVLPQKVEAPMIEVEKEQTIAAPKDQVQIGQKEEPKEGLLHKMFRGAGKAAGGFIGLPIGAASGAIKGAGSESVIQFSPEVVKTFRAMGATFGLLAGLAMGSSMGPVGLAVGAILGPVAGSTFGGAYVGAIDGLWAGAKGAVKGAKKGIKKGAELGGKTVDWIANKFANHTEEPKPPTENPKPPAEESKS